MSRAAAIARAHSYFDSGDFVVDLRRRVAIPSTSQEPDRAGALRSYLDDEMVPSLAPLGFTSRILENPSGPAFLVAERIEDADFLTVLIYGHGDTVRGLDDLWRSGLSPWVLTVEGPRIYGRGTADNKGQHSINIAALTAALAERGRSGAGLGFNTKILIEMGEEVGSAGLRELCMKHKQGLLHADLLIASDGPRIAPDRPTLFLGARGGYRIDLVVDLREGGHHSGNWGGLLADRVSKRRLLMITQALMAIPALALWALATSGVPASNLLGTSAQVERSSSTRWIMLPPPRNGGIASSSSGRAQSTPAPIGAQALWPLKARKSTSSSRTDTGMWGTLWQASTAISAPQRWARSASSRIGFTVPSTSRGAVNASAVNVIERDP